MSSDTKAKVQLSLMLEREGEGSNLSIIMMLNFYN